MSNQMLDAYIDLKSHFEVEIEYYGKAYLCNILARDIDAPNDIKDTILAEIHEKIGSSSTWYNYMMDNGLIDEEDLRIAYKIANRDRIKWLNQQIKKYGGK